jgi:hypothetical protein
MFEALEEQKLEMKNFLQIDALPPSKVSAVALHLRTFEERRLDARIEYRGGRDVVLRNTNDFTELVQPHYYDENPFWALQHRVTLSIDDWIAQDARIDRYWLSPDSCYPPTISETEQRLRDFEKSRTKEDLTFYRTVAKLEFRKLTWHRYEILRQIVILSDAKNHQGSGVAIIVISIPLWEHVITA